MTPASTAAIAAGQHLDGAQTASRRGPRLLDRIGLALILMVLMFVAAPWSSDR